MRPQEVCFDARMFWHTGIGSYIRKLLPAFKETFPRLKVIVPPDLGKNEPLLTDCDLILSNASIYSLKEQWDFFFRIPKIDLFFSPHYNVPWIPIRAKKRVVMIHDVFHLAHLSQFELHKRIYAKYTLKQAVNRSDLIFTISSFSRDEICKYTNADPSKIHHISLGVDRKLFRPKPDQKIIEQVIKKYVLFERFFLFVGGLKPHKNLIGVLLALEQMPAARLVVIGERDGTHTIHQRYPHLAHRIRWVFSVTDEELPGFYHLAQALVFPSYYEGFGLPPLEAMACGCPVIVSNRASIPEVCGQAALYVAPDNPQEIRSAMEQIILDPCLKASLVEAGSKNQERFDQKRSNARHIELIDRLFL